MKGRIISLFLILTLILASFISCGKGIKTKEFTHCELTLVLDDSFSEEKSDTFDLLLSNGDIAVSLIRISFEAGYGQGISDTYTAKGFAAYFLNRSEKTAELSERGSVPYYVYSEKTDSGTEISYAVSFYRSHNAYFVVTYAVQKASFEALSDRIYGYFDSAYFNDAPIID